MNEKKEGIDLIKKVIKNIVETTKEVIEDKKNDGKISKAEYFGLADNAISLGSNLLNAGQLVKEIKDVDSEEGRELLNYTISLGITGDKAQIVLLNAYEIVEKAISMIPNFKAIAEVFKKEE